MERHIGFDGMVHLMLKSHYSKKNNDYLTGTFYKGRMLDMTGTEYGVMIKYMTPYFSLCTTNKLKTAIFKDPNEDMTITYKITDEEWSI